MREQEGKRGREGGEPQAGERRRSGDDAVHDASIYAQEPDRVPGATGRPADTI